MKHFLRFLLISFVILGILHAYDIDLSIGEFMVLGLFLGTVDSFIEFFFGGDK